MAKKSTIASRAAKPTFSQNMFALRLARSTRTMVPTTQRWFAAQAFLPVEEVTERVFTVIKANEKVDPAKVTEAAHYVNDLGLDSLDHVEVLMAVEEEFAIEIPDAEAEKILTCADTISFITSHPQAK